MKTLLVLSSLVSISVGIIFGGGGGFSGFPGLKTTCKPPSSPYQSYYSPKKSKYGFGDKITFKCLSSYELAKSVTKTCIFGTFHPTNEHAVCNPVCTKSGYEWTKFYDRDDPSVTGDHELRSRMRNPNVCAKPASIDARVVGTNKDFRTTKEKVEISPSLGLICLKKNNNNRCSDYEVRFCCDADECASSPCSSHGTCINTDGSFTCECNTGYVGNGFYCIDIDECRGFPCSSHGACKNTGGSFECTCNRGYVGNGLSCADADECSSSPCSSHGTCTNTDGSFQCSCNTGYQGNGFFCTDINECTGGPDFCGIRASCSNTPGGASCSCPKGTTGNPKVECTVIDVDECAAGTDNCHADATCQNTVGSFTCTCNSGYTGDGTQCDKVTCSNPTPPPNTKPFYGRDSFNIGDKYYFTCEDHYYHDHRTLGLPKYICGSDGEWYGSAPVCEGSCIFVCTEHTKDMKGDPPCGCDPTCKVNGTCCGDYEEYCEACSKGCKDKPGCKCSNCSVDCCENFEQTCLNPRTTSSTYFPFATLRGPSGKK